MTNYPKFHPNKDNKKITFCSIPIARNTMQSHTNARAIPAGQTDQQALDFHLLKKHSVNFLSKISIVSQLRYKSTIKHKQKKSVKININESFVHMTKRVPI
jgi:hypothetical protein